MKSFALAAGLSIGLLPLSALAECSENRIELKGDWGQAAFSVELADDAKERAVGLMFRESMSTGAGMLFIYEKPVNAVFWMKNTLIPLDMLFINPEGRVTRIHENAIPGDETPIDGGEDILAVLEINGGLAKSMGITEGSLIRYPAMDQEIALWSCEEG